MKEQPGGRGGKGTPAPARWAAVALALAALALRAAPREVQAQAFGQNKVQYNASSGRCSAPSTSTSTTTRGPRSRLQHAAPHGRARLPRLSRVLGHQIRARVPLVLYASHTDFEQTNITPG